MKNLILKFCAASLIIFAGTLPNATAAEALVSTNAAARSPYQEWNVGLEAGSTGFGLSGAWRFSDHVGLRVGADYVRLTLSDAEIGSIKYDSKLRLLSEPLTLDVYPWKNHSFRISFGWMFNQNELTGTAGDTGTIIIDGQPFPSPIVGTLNLKITQQPVNPYLTVGGNLFYFDRAHRWAFAGELGVVYTGDPAVTLTRTGPPSAVVDAAVAGAQKAAQDYADQFKWWPVIKLAVTASF